MRAPVSDSTAKKTATRSPESFFHLPGGPRTHATLCFFYYLAIIVAMLLIYGRGEFVTAPFIYQGY